MDDAANVSCSACRHVNPFGSAFCNACGARLDERRSSATPSQKGPRPLFRTPLVPDEVRNALGPVPGPMPPKQPDANETDGTAPPSGLGVVADTGRAISRPPEVRTSSRRLADESASKKVTIPTLELPLPQAMRYTNRGNDSRRKTLAKALSGAALIALLAIGGAMVADRAKHASVQPDDQSAARLSVAATAQKPVSRRRRHLTERVISDP